MNIYESNNRLNQCPESTCRPRRSRYYPYIYANNKKNTVMATESTDGALQMSVVKNPIATIIVQESSKRGVWRSTKRVKEFE